MEFSDDEKEAAYLRSLRQSKRTADNTSHEKQETAINKRTNFEGSSASDTRRGNQIVMNRTNLNGPSRNGKRNQPAIRRKTNFKSSQSNDHWHGNQERVINKRTNIKGPLSNDHWHGNKKRAIDKRTNIKGAPIRKCKQSPRTCTKAAMGQPQPSIPGSLQAPAAAAQFGCINGTSVGTGNRFVSNPPSTMQPVQLGASFSDLSQQLLLQQINTLMSHTPLDQLNMLLQGGYPMNVFRSPHVGGMVYPPQHQNQVFNGFPNAAICQQFIPKFGAVANLPWFSELQNLSTGAMGQPNAGQGSFGSSNVHDQGTLQSCGQPPVAIDQGGVCPIQFSPFVSPISLGAEGHASAGQTGVRWSNLQEQQASGSSSTQNYPHPQPSIGQGGIHPMLSSPSICPTSLGAEGQSIAVPAGLSSSSMQEQRASGSRVAESSKQQDGKHLPGQFNLSCIPISVGLVGHPSSSKAPVNNSMLEQGDSFSVNIHNHLQPQPSLEQGGVHPPPPMQFKYSIGPTTLGPMWQSNTGEAPFRFVNMQEQVASGSFTLQSYRQPPSATGQGRMHPPLPMQPMGQSNTDQASFGCVNLQEQEASGSLILQNYRQPPTATDQGRMYPSSQFNPGRSSCRGRNPNQRDRRHFF